MNAEDQKPVTEEEAPDTLEEDNSIEATEEEEIVETEVETPSTSRPSTPLDMPENVVFVEERLYVVPFRRLVFVPVKRRAKKAVSVLREFAVRHMKSEYVLIHPKVNEQIWARGISHPPRKLRVRMAKDTDGVVHVLPTSS